MKLKAYHVAFPATLIVIIVAFLSTIFLANANTSLAASVKKKAPAVASTSAVEQTEVRIKQLQDALKFTKDQEVLWNNVTLVMRENAKDMDALTKDKAESTKAMTAVEHMKFHSQLSELQLSHMKKFIPPFEALYVSMSDEQKQITDTIFRTGKHGKHKIK
jgi:hypothetical protein